MIRHGAVANPWSRSGVYTRGWRGQLANLETMPVKGDLPALLSPTVSGGDVAPLACALRS